MYGPITAYEINHFEQCIYVLNGTGIIQICYGGKGPTDIPTGKLLVTDTGIKGFKIDKSTNNLYYFNHTTIFVMQVISGYRRVIFKTEHLITLITLAPMLG